MMSGVHFHTAQQRRERAGTPMEQDWPRLPGCWDRGVGRCRGAHYTDLSSCANV